MKRWLPIALKQWLWQVFKTPQRKMVGWHTLWTDLKAALFLKQPSSLQPVTICIGIKDRNMPLLHHVIPSLNNCNHPELITLSIDDAGSTDLQNPEASIRQYWKGALIYNRHKRTFTRSLTFNAAIQQSNTELVMACDADISLPTDIVEKINRYATKTTAWFPQVWWLNNDKTTGRFFSEGTGIFAATKTNFNATGGYDESITQWGKEDWLLYFAFYKKGIACLRTNEQDMVHHPHPSLKPDDFEKMF